MGVNRNRSGRAFTRRAALQVGCLGVAGLSLDRLWEARALSQHQTAGRFGGRAKACILLFMWGGPSQLDTFDLKPDAPAEIRGPFQPIPTAVPGLQICEHFPKLAMRMDRVALIRSLCHDDPAHLSSAHYTVTGHRAPKVRSDVDPPSQNDTPHLGATLSAVRGADNLLPPWVMLPWKAFHPAAPGGEAPGQHGGWLGRQFDPLLVGGDPNAADWRVAELALPAEITLQRLDSRQKLLSQIDAQRAALAGNGEAIALSGYKSQAVELLSSSHVGEAFDLQAESVDTRDRYGRNLHGQCVLLARRLVERGVPLVAVHWHNDGQNFWDTHGNNFDRLQRDLIPPADAALAALLDDLQERGLLDETIVAWVGEFGRRPQITQQNAGREHWPFCYSGLLAGGGIAGGAVYGRSDRHGGRPAADPVSPGDFAATLLAALGVPPGVVLPDRLGRPLRVCDGAPLQSLLG